MSRAFRLSILLLLTAALAGCAFKFNSDWRKAAQAQKLHPPTTLEGAWVGTWSSTSTGHKGKLRAVITAVPAPAGISAPATVYKVTYHATWGGVLSGTFATEHTAKPSTKNLGTMELSGEKDLGVLGGLYSFTGTATPQTFRADYKSSMDYGVFEMKRPEP